MNGLNAQIIIDFSLVAFPLVKLRGSQTLTCALLSRVVDPKLCLLYVTFWAPEGILGIILTIHNFYLIFNVRVKKKNLLHAFKL